MMLTRSHRSSSQILSKVQEQRAGGGGAAAAAGGDTSEMETSDKVHCTTHGSWGRQPADRCTLPLNTTTNILDSHS